MTTKTLKTGLKTAATTVATMPLWATTYAMAQVADVTGALEINQDALAEVEGSTLTEDGIEGTIVSVGNIVLILAGVIGIIMAAFGVAKLYGHYKEGEQARGGTIGYWAMVMFGGLMTIIAIVTAFFPTLFLDGV